MPEIMSMSQDTYNKYNQNAIRQYAEDALINFQIPKVIIEEWELVNE